MQTPKTRGNSSEVPQKKATPTFKSARQLKIPASDSDSISSSANASSKTPKERSPKVSERKSPRTPGSEKKRIGRVSELESELAQLKEDLKKVKDQLSSAESGKRQAQYEAEEAKKKLLVMEEKLEESQQQLMDLSASEDVRVQELRKISQERDKAWQSELEAVQKQQAMDSAALVSAMNEIKKLRIQLEKVGESEATQTKHAESAHHDIQRLRVELSETLSLVETLRTELSDCREAEAQALEVVRNTEKQLEIANVTADTLRSECMKTVEAYNSIAVELEQSKDRIKELEGLVDNLRADQAMKNDMDEENEDRTVEEVNQLKDELNSIKLEASKLKSALDAAETRYQEEYIQSTLQIRTAYDQVERTKQESCQKQAALEEELKIAMRQIEELRKDFIDKESELRASERDLALMAELEKLQIDLSELKQSLCDKERKLQNLSEENEAMKAEINRRDAESIKVNGEAAALTEAAQTAEREAMMKLGSLTEEADESNKRAARITEQLDAAQAANSEMEAELRRLKVQSDQWRKAAEVAASMLSTTGTNGKLVERTGSIDSYYTSVAGTMGSPYSEDMMEDDSPKKKNGNVLKKIGVLWKKGQK